MLLVKKTTAWDELENLVDDIPTATADAGNPLVRLYDAIQDASQEDALDAIVSSEFPKGVEPDELKEFFEEEQAFIFEELGIDLSTDGDYEDEDGDEDEDD